MIANLCEPCGKGDVRKLRALIEGLIPDLGQCLRQCDAFQHRTAVEGTLQDIAARYGDGFEGGGDIVGRVRHGSADGNIVLLDCLRACDTGTRSEQIAERVLIFIGGCFDTVAHEGDGQRFQRGTALKDIRADRGHACGDGQRFQLFTVAENIVFQRFQRGR